MEHSWRVAQPLQLQWWQEADRDTKMYVGQQDSGYWYNNNYSRNTQLIFNKILRVVNLISGYQRKNRMVNVCTPIENADNETASQLTEMMMWASNRIGLYELISKCFESALVTGFSLLSYWVDHREDPINGDIKARCVPYSGILMDPYWKDPNLEDCDWIWQRSYRTKEQVIGLFPNLKNNMPSLEADGGRNTGDGKFTYLPQNRGMYGQTMFTYDEYWTKEYRTVEKLLDTESGEVMERPRDMDNDILEAFMSFNKNIQIIKAKKPTVKYHVLVNDQLVYEEKTPYGLDYFPYVPFTCYFNPEVQDYAYRYMGVVRNIRDAQCELNTRRNKMLDILDSQVNSGLIVKEDALVNPEDAFLSGQGRVYYLKETAQPGDIQQIPAAQLPPSLFELQNMLDNEIMNISGVNEELFGTSDDPTISGFLTQLRMGAGLVSLGNIFDNLNASQKLAGLVLMNLIQVNYEPGKIRRVLNKDPTPEFKTKAFSNYDCVVEEGILTSTQRQMQFVQLLQLKQMGIPIPTEELLKASTFQNKNELIETIVQQEQQQAQMQQQQQQGEIEKLKMVSNSLDAEAESNRALAEERKTRAVGNIGLAQERASSTVHNLNQSVLDQAKTMVELQQLDETRLFKLYGFLQQLDEEQKKERAIQQAQNFIGAQMINAPQQLMQPQPPQEELMMQETVDQPLGV